MFNLLNLKNITKENNLQSQYLATKFKEHLPVMFKYINWTIKLAQHKYQNNQSEDKSA
jgi:hypothetical protein